MKCNPLTSHLIYHLTSPVIYGHRGASKSAPENTLAAFEIAFKKGAPAIELDATLSLDQNVVVIHDDTVNRTTNGYGFVNELTLKELKKLDAGSKFSEKFREERIPTLDEVFDLITADRLVNIELKNYHSINDQLVPRVCERVVRRNKKNSVLLSSFSIRNIHRAQKILPDVPVAWIIAEGGMGKIKISHLLRWLSPDLIHVEYHLVTKRILDREHSFHRKVNVWTVDKETELGRFFDANIDGVITNDPELAVNLKNAKMVK